MLINRPHAHHGASLHAWGEYVKRTHYPATVRSWQAAHAAIGAFAVYACHGENLMPVIGIPEVVGFRDFLVTEGNSPSTINTKLSYVNVLLATMRSYGVKQITDFKMPYVARKSARKWWMKDEQWTKLQNYLRDGADTTIPFPMSRLLLDYIEWTMETGLRVEETLRLLPSDFVDNYRSLVVPGTKNAQSAVQIPISDKALGIITKRASVANWTAGSKAQQRLFDVSYASLHNAWHQCRVFLGVQDDPTSTLKALRRNFAATCLLKGIPDRLIQELMRHSDLKTTMGYLHLVGLSDNQATRDMLNRDIEKAKRPVTDADAEEIMKRHLAAMQAELAAKGIKTPVEKL